MATSLARAGNRVTVDSVVGSADPLCANAHRLNPKGTVRLAHLATQCRCESRSPVRTTRRGVVACFGGKLRTASRRQPRTVCGQLFPRPGWATHLPVDDIAEAASRVGECGGTAIRKPRDAEATTTARRSQRASNTQMSQHQLRSGAVIAPPAMSSESRPTSRSRAAPVMMADSGASTSSVGGGAWPSARTWISLSYGS